MPQPRLQFLSCLVVYTLLLRLLPYILMKCDVHTDPSALYYPWNFSPLTAVCLFGGAFLADRRMAFLLPLAILFLSDLGILALTGKMDWAFPAGSWGFTYFSFTSAAALGLLLRNTRPRRFPVGPLAVGLGFEAAFFAVSNFLVWFGSTSSPTPLYPGTLAGLGECYIAGLPFFGKSLLGTATFTTLLFSPLGIRAGTDADSERTSGELAPVRVRQRTGSR